MMSLTPNSRKLQRLQQPSLFRGRLFLLCGLAAALLLLLFLGIGSPQALHAASPNTLYVTPGGSDSNDCSLLSPCLTIQQAITNAVAGDEIRVAAGTYTGSGLQVVAIGKSLTLRGGFTTDNWLTPDPLNNVTVVDGQNARRGILVTTSSPDTQVMIEGFHIRNGLSQGTDNVEGAGVRSSNARLTLKNNRIYDNEIIGITLNHAGGGVASMGANDHLTLLDNHIYNNQAAYGAAMSIGNGGSASIEGNHFYDNLATTTGVIMILNGDVLHFRNNLVYHNQANNHSAGVHVGQNSSVVIENSTFYDNAATNRGGALYLFDASAIVSNTLFVENSNSASEEGTFYLSGNSVLTVTTSDFHNNTPGYSQGDLNNWGNGNLLRDPQFVDAGNDDFRLQAGSEAIDSGTDIPAVTRDVDGNGRPYGTGWDRGAHEYTPASDCYARIAGGRVYTAIQDAVSAATFGDTVKVAGTCQGVTVMGAYTQTVFINTSLTLSGGYTVTNWDSPSQGPTILDAQGQGRVIYVAGTGWTVLVENLHLTGGAADNGAGIFVPATIDFTLRNSALYANAASQHGGGLFTNAEAEVSFSTFYNNSAAQLGGAIYANWDTLYLANSALVQNSALEGGGLYRAPGAEIAADYNNVYANTSDNYGNMLPGPHDLQAPPLFLAPGSGDFRLDLQSPLINAADPAATLSYDFEGDPRPAGNRADIGMDEQPIFAAVEITPKENTYIEEQLDLIQGEIITFTHTMTNTGYLPGLSDTYDIVASNGDGWPLTEIGDFDAVELDIGEGHTFAVAVQVPSDVTAGFYNRTLITATSRTSDEAYDVALDAIANPGLLFTPNYTRTADPGQTLTYTHRITNIGPSDLFTLTLESGEGWGEVVSHNLDVPLALGPQETAEIIVVLNVPAHAASGLQDVTTLTATSHAFGISAQVMERTTAKGTSGTRYVTPGGEDSGNNCTQMDTPCKNVGHAVEQAAAGDEILIAEGDYISDEVLLDKYVVIKAGYRYASGEFVEIEEGPDPNATVIDFQGSRGIRVTTSAGSGPLLAGFTITNTGAGGGYGGALLLDGNAQLQELFIHSAQAALGGAIYITTTGTLQMEDVTISMAQANAGGAIYNQAGTILADGLVIYHNRAAQGAGGALYNAQGTLSLVNTMIYSNTAATSGGGIYNAGQLTLLNATLADNHAASFGGGLYDHNSLGLNVRNTIFYSNTASTGGGLYQAGVPLTSADYNLFWHNQAPTHPQSNLAFGPHTLQKDPRFEDPLAGDYHLTFESPAIDTADPNTELDEDFEDDPRPSNHGYDIGADELRGCLARVVNPATGEQIGDLFDGVQQAVDFAPPAHIVQLSGLCFGVQARELHGEVVSQTVYITKSLTLRGGYPPTFDTESVEPTYLDALGEGRVVVVTNPATETIAVALSRLTLRNGRSMTGHDGGGVYNDVNVMLYLEETIISGARAGSGGHGGGLFNRAGAMLTLASSEFLSSTATSGGGLYNAGILTTISRTLFLDNAATQHGGGLYNAAGGSLELEAATVISNSARLGGGLYNAATGALTLTNSLVVSNTVAENGGGLFNLSPDLTLRHDTFFSNYAQNGAAIYHDAATTGALINSTLLVSNTASSLGGALYSADQPPAFTYNGVYGNLPGNYSPGFTPGTGTLQANPHFISLLPNSANFLRIPGGSPVEDQADPNSPILVDIEDTPRPTNENFDIGADEVGECYVRINGLEPTYGNVQRAIDNSSAGDVLYIAGTCRGVNEATVDSTTVYQTAFVDHDLGFQGGFTFTNWLEPQPTVFTTTLDANGSGRVAYLSGSHVITMAGLHLVGGAADNGAGLLVAGGVVSLTNNHLHNNSATGDGGALYHDGGELILDGNYFYDNDATQGGALYQGGGALWMVNNILHRNNAQRGAGVYNGSTASFALYHNTFYANSATEGGGLYTANHAPDVRNNIFANNSGSGHAIYSATPDYSTPDYNDFYPFDGQALENVLLLQHNNVGYAPGFQDAAAENFHLSDESLLLDQGDPAMPLFHDMEGDLRPGDQGFDIGADERRSCWARVQPVGREPLGPFGNPQLAIGHSQPGDIIQVTVGECRGVHTYEGATSYLQTVHVTESVILRGGYLRDFSRQIDSDVGYENDETRTIFNPQGQGHALLAHTKAITVEEINLIGGNALAGGGVDATGEDAGGAFYADVEQLLMDEVGIYTSEATHGGGLYFEAEHGTLIQIGVFSNTATMGGGLYVPSASGYVTISTVSEFANNTATYGGGIYNRGGDLYLEELARIRDNNATTQGGGIYQHGSSSASLTLAGASIYANSAPQGAGVYAETHANLLSDYGTRFFLNEAQQGGAIYGGGNNFRVQNSLIYTNTAQYGGGIYLLAAGNNRVEHNTIVSNLAVQQGGALYVQDAGDTMLVRNNIFEENQAPAGSAVYATVGELNYNDYWPATASEQIAGGVGIDAVYYNELPMYIKGTIVIGNAETLEQLDFHIESFSPLVDAGVDVGLDHDMDEHPRPVNGKPDVGADEYPECLAKVADTGDIYGEIQTAIDRAEEGGSVYVAEGTCYERLIINKELTLSGSFDKRFTKQHDQYINTLVNGEESGRVLTVGDPSGAATNVTLDQIAFGYGVVTSDGGGIYVRSNTSVLMDHVPVLHNHADGDGGGIYIATGAEVDGADMSLYSNEAGGIGGGIYNASGATLSLCGSGFSYNTAVSSGGGLYSAAGATLAKLNNSSFRYNQAGTETSIANGGGLFNASGNTALTNVAFIENIATGDGGGIYNSGGNVDFLHNTLVANEAEDQGGGLYNSGSGGGFYAGIVANNKAPSGAGIFNTASPQLPVAYTMQWQNEYVGINGAEGNLQKDPLLSFLYPTTNSPAIDAVPVEYVNSLSYDNVMNPRQKAGPSYTYICDKDMGYHEYSVGKRAITWTLPSEVTLKPGTLHTYTIKASNQSEEYGIVGDERTSRGPGTGYTETIQITWSSSRDWARVVGVSNAANVITVPEESRIIFDVGPGRTANILLQVAIPQGQYASVEDDPTTMETTRLSYEAWLGGCHREDDALTGDLEPLVTQVALSSECTLTPEGSGSAAPGESITYTHVITNQGNLTTTYTLAPSSGFYAAAEIVSPTRFITEPLATLRLAPGMSATVKMRVTVRPEIAAGLIDISTLIGTYQGARQCAIADSTTTLETSGIRYVSLNGSNSTIDETIGGNPTDLPDNNCTQPQVAPCRTLHYALDQARAGEEVRIAGGTYTETYTVAAGGVLTQMLYLDKPLTITGGYQEGAWDDELRDHVAHPTLLIPEAAGRVIYIATTEPVRLERLTLTGGTASGMGGGPSGEDAGGNLYNVGANLTLNALDVAQGQATLGGGLYSAGGALVLTNNMLYANGDVNTLEGGALYLESGSGYLLNNTFDQNYALYDGAAVYATGDLTLINNLITTHNTEAEGGNGDYAAVHALGTYSGDYNLWYANAAQDVSGNATLGAHALTQDPLLDIRHLTDNSPAREAGDPATNLNLFPWERDYDNQPRRMGARIDIGADEFLILPDFALVPAYQTKVQAPGTALAYTHYLTNTGEFTDTFTLDFSSSRGWIDNLNTSAIELPPGAGTTLLLSGDIPAGSGGLSDSTVLTATSGLSTGPEAVKTALDVTRASFTPGVSVTPASQSGTTEPGVAISYPFTVTNASSDGWDNFTMTVASQQGWTAGVIPAVTPLLEPGTTTQVTVTVIPPAGALSGTVDVVQVTATSSFDGVTAGSASASTTVSYVPGVLLESDASQDVGMESSVTYDHTLTNSGNYTATFTLSYQSSLGWSGTFLAPDTGAPIVVTLEPGESVPVEFRLTIPAGSGGETDTTTLTARIQDGATQDTVVDTTTVTPNYDLTLTPSSQSQDALPNDVVDFEHTLTNTGNATDTYDLSVDGDQPGWVTHTPGSVTLPAGGSATVVVTVSVPSDASGGTVTTDLTAQSQQDSGAVQTVADIVNVEGVLEPVTSVTASNESPTELGQATPLSAIADGSRPITYTWNFGDGSPEVETTNDSITHIYPAVDIYTAIVTATNAATTNPPSDTTLVTIIEAQVCEQVEILSLTSTSPVTEGTAIQFTTDVTGTLPYTYTWDFGGAGVTGGTQANPTYLYDSAGTYTVTLTVTNTCGSDSAQLFVTVNPAVTPQPITTLTADNDSPKQEGETVTFRAIADGSRPITYTWNFGDGSPEVETTASTTPHSYTTAGVYTATVTATNEATPTPLTASTRVTITAVCNPAAIMSLTSNSPVSEGTAVQFTTGVAGTLPITYLWDFGGAGAMGGTQTNPTYLYDSAGTYTVTLTVTNTCGSDSEQLPVTVTSGPDPLTGLQAFNDSPTPLGVTTTLSATVDGGDQPITYTWNFGDGSGEETFTGEDLLSEVSHLYAAAGDYTATVTATNATHTLTATTQVTIVPRGVALAPDNTWWAEPGEVVTYTHTLTNTGAFPDSFTLAVTSTWDSELLTAQPVALAGGASAEVRVRVTVPDSPLQASDIATVTATSQGDPATAASARDVTRVLQQQGALLEPDRAGAAAPGETLTYTHRLTNTSATTLTFALEASENPLWGTANVVPASVELAPGAAHPVTATLTVPGGTLSDTLHMLRIVATAQEEDAQAFAEDRTTVTQVFGVALVADEQRQGAPGEVVTIVHTLTNTGNGEDTFDFNHTVPPWTVDLQPASLTTLAAGATTPVTLTVTIPASAVPREQVMVKVTAISQGDPAQTATVTDIVTVVEEQLPLTGLQAFNDSPTQEGQVTILSTTVEGGSEPITYTWDFGDGNGGSGAQVTHTYPAAGNYVATVTATNAINTLTATTPVTITAAPPPGHQVYLPIVVRNYTDLPEDAPNLVVTGIVLIPSVPQAGEATSVRVTVQNQGTRPVAQGNNFYVDFYVDQTPRPLLPSNVKITWGAQGTWFGVGESYTFVASYQFPDAGSYTLYAQADTDNTVLETAENDNIKGPQTVNVEGGLQSEREPLPVLQPLREPRPTPTPLPAP